MEITIQPLASIRLKVNSGCPWTCYFCHHEGTEKAKDISVEETVSALKFLKEALSINELKVTGGEPTLFPGLFGLFSETKKLGYDKITMTTFGCFEKEKLAEWKKAGLDKLNFSLRSLSAENFVKIQQWPKTTESIEKARKAIKEIKENIFAAKKSGLGVGINFVVTPHASKEFGGFLELAKKAGVKAKIMNELGTKSVAESRKQIEQFLKKNNAELKGKRTIYPTSNAVYCYDVNGQEVLVKYMQSFFLPSVCRGCSYCFKHDECEEGFYGIRLEDKPLKARLCLYKDYEGPWLQEFEKFKRSPQLRELKERLVFFSPPETEKMNEVLARKLFAKY